MFQRVILLRMIGNPTTLRSEWQERYPFLAILRPVPQSEIPLCAIIQIHLQEYRSSLLRSK